MRIDVDQKRVEVECNWDLGSRREAAAKAVEKGAKKERSSFTEHPLPPLFLFLSSEENVPPEVESNASMGGSPSVERGCIKPSIRQDLSGASKYIWRLLFDVPLRKALEGLKPYFSREELRDRAEIIPLNGTFWGNWRALCRDSGISSQIAKTFKLWRLREESTCRINGVR